MIITRTPFRISFFGGGTDYPIYYNENGGSVLSATINKYCYITCRYLPPFFKHKYLIRYSKTETVNSIDEIMHPSVRECLKFLNIKEGLEIVYTADVPAMSGIGSSSSFTVGLLNALYALKGQMVSKRKLAYDAIHVEQNMIKEHVGSQDQVAASFGGFNRINFGGTEGIFVQPITLTQEKKQYLEDSLLFYFTGFARFSSDIAKEQIKQTPNKLNELSFLKEMVEKSIYILNGNLESYNDFGLLLNEAWKIKRSLTSKISNSTIDQIYEIGLSAGALGGKICGAGGGGFIIFFVPSDRKDFVKTKLNKYMNVPFWFENIGTHVIHYS